MARPTRKHPALPIYESPESRAMRSNLATVIGDVEYQAVARVGEIHVFRLSGPAGVGLLAEHAEPVEERPGVRLSTESAWIHKTGANESWVMDGRFHDRDAASGDQRTAEVARDDTLAVSAIPTDAVPALMAGLTPERVRELAAAHAPELVR